MRFRDLKQAAAILLLTSTIIEGFISTHAGKRVITKIFIRKDTEIVFGSNSSSGLNSDEDEEFAREQQERKAIVDKVLQEQDNEFKEERRRKKWGDFADAAVQE